MAKTEVIPFRSFMDGSYKNEGKSDITALKKVITATTGSLLMILPKAAFAATVNSTFGNVHGAIMNAFDAGVVLVIIFSGASWALGHRTKALEILIGVSCGYILARHAIDIRDFLQGI
ncbi:glycosyltransferase (plasmid) [Bacillus cereus]|uniref:glycosyltransferase n=1 Tax=Bacillus cereus TaxID=1396 RepID=UPI001B8D6C2A|nr:glycosyltransferase [Bacillus cereus]QUW34621.1 glycosyltransferase [Bacillus cereus]